MSLNSPLLTIGLNCIVHALRNSLNDATKKKRLFHQKKKIPLISYPVLKYDDIILIDGHNAIFMKCKKKKKKKNHPLLLMHHLDCQLLLRIQMRKEKHPKPIF